MEWAVRRSIQSLPQQGKVPRNGADEVEAAPPRKGNRLLDSLKYTAHGMGGVLFSCFIAVQRAVLFQYAAAFPAALRPNPATSVRAL